MARQTGPVYYTGTIGPITYYKLFGEHYYLRTKSSLTRKRFQTDPAFEQSRQRSKEFGAAAQLASHINNRLPKTKKGKGFMGKLIGRIHWELLAGKSAVLIEQEIMQEYGVMAIAKAEDSNPKVNNRPATVIEKTLPLFWVTGYNDHLQQTNSYRPSTKASNLPGSLIACSICKPPS